MVVPKMKHIYAIDLIIWRRLWDNVLLSIDLFQPLLYKEICDWNILLFTFKNVTEIVKLIKAHSVHVR